MKTNQVQEFISIKKLAIKYDIHPDTIRKKDLIEGKHYIKIGKLTRYNVLEMHRFLTTNSNNEKVNLNNFFIN